MEKSDRMLMVRSGIASGLTDEELAHELEIPVDDIIELRALVMKEEVDRLSGSAEESFALYLIFTQEKIEELGSLYTRLMSEGSAKQANAAVGAVRAQHDLYERLMKRGTDMGIVKATIDGEESELSKLEDVELTAELQRRLESIQRLRAHQQGVPLSEVTMKPPAFAKKKKEEEVPIKETPRSRPGVSKITRRASLRRS